MSDPDRISELSDSLLTHILSYLTTKEAVHTWLLSKRWENVWASVPVLDFDFADFWSEDMFSRPENTLHDFPNIVHVDSRSECHENFVRFIDSVLAARQVQQQLDRFRLVWQYQVETYYYHAHPVRRWILFLVQQRLRVLSIYVQPSVSNVYVPDQTFNCSSLEEMKLHVENRWPEILEPASVNLPRLRRLNLGYFMVKNDFINKLLLGCPILEELELYACALDISEISGGNLKSLVINGCCHFREIRVSIPTLQYLKVTVFSSQTTGIVLGNMPLLVKACVCFLTTDEYFEQEFFNSEAKILYGLSHVTNLDVVLYGSNAKEMLEHSLKNCPYFANLKAMHFKSYGDMICCFDMIASLVQQSPALEEIIIYRSEDESDNEIEFIEELREVLSQDGNCRVIESNLQHSYHSVDQLNKLLVKYMKLFEKMEAEAAAEEEEDEEDEEEEEEEEGGEEAWWLEEEEGEEAEASWAEEEEQGDPEGEQGEAGGGGEEGEEVGGEIEGESWWLEEEEGEVGEAGWAKEEQEEGDTKAEQGDEAE